MIANHCCNSSPGKINRASTTALPTNPTIIIMKTKRKKRKEKKKKTCKYMVEYIIFDPERFLWVVLKMRGCVAMDRSSAVNFVNEQ